MNRTQYLLCKLAEEAAEIAQIALKSQQFGLEEVYIDKSNKERCHAELNDLMGVILALNKDCNFGYAANAEDMQKKVKKIDEYYKYSKNCGQIQEG